MSKIIKVQIYGIENQILGGGRSSEGCGGCSSKASKDSSECGNSHGKGCGGCGSTGGCSSKTPKTMIKLYEELVVSIKSSDINHCVELEFLDIRKVNILDNDDIRTLYDMDYELPYCVIDGVVRYYGGISSALIYKDIKELMD